MPLILDLFLYRNGELDLDVVLRLKSSGVTNRAHFLCQNNSDHIVVSRAIYDNLCCRDTFSYCQYAPLCRPCLIFFFMLTHFTIEVHRDSDYQGSRGLKALYWYDPTTLKRLLDVLLLEQVTQSEVEDLDEVVVSWSDMVKDIPEDWKGVVSHCLDPDTNERIGARGLMSPSDLAQGYPR